VAIFLVAFVWIPLACR